jgi:hypothetical protein
VTIRLPSTIHAALSASADHLISSASALVRDYLILSHQTGALAAYLATRSGTPNPVGLTDRQVPGLAPSAAPAEPTEAAPVRIERTPEEQAIYLDELFDSPEEKAAKAAARAAAKAPHTASTPAPAPTPDDVLTPEEQAKEARRAEKRAEYERIKANTPTPEQVMARIAEGMAAVRAQPGHGYIEPWVPVTHAPHREPLTPSNSAELPEAGTPEWIAMAERQGLPPEAIAEVVAATQPSAAPEPKVVSGSFDFDAWGD